MTEQEARNLMMGYLFNEIDDHHKKEFESRLKESPEMQHELEELKQTLGILQTAPPRVPPHKLVVMPSSQQVNPEDRGSSAWFNFHPAVKTVFAIAASILIVMIGSAFTGLQLGKTESGFYLTFGDAPVQQPAGISEEQVHVLLDQLRNEQTILFAGMMEEVQNQQNEQFTEVLGHLTDYYDQRRRQDLLLISDGFNQLEEQTNYRLTRTNQTLGDLIYAISNP